MKRLEKFFAWSAFILSIISLAVGYQSNSISNKSLDVANKAEQTTKDLFLIEKRPYINLEVYGGPNSYLRFLDRNAPRAEYSVALRNKGGIAAKNITIKIEFINDDSQVLSILSIPRPKDEIILPGNSDYMDVRFGDEKGTPLAGVIQRKSINVRMTVEYQSDVDSKVYSSIIFVRIEPSKVTFLGGLGEYK